VSCEATIVRLDVGVSTAPVYHVVQGALDVGSCSAFWRNLSVNANIREHLSWCHSWVSINLRDGIPTIILVNIGVAPPTILLVHHIIQVVRKLSRSERAWFANCNVWLVLRGTEHLKGKSKL